MLSKNMTVSLMSLITIVALAFAVSPAMAAKVADHPTGLAHAALPAGHAHFATALSYYEAMNVDGRSVGVTIKFDKVVSLAAVQASKLSVTIVNSDFSSTTYQAAIDADSDAGFSTTPVADPVVLGANLSGIMQEDMNLSVAGDQFDGKTFWFSIAPNELKRKGFATDGSVDASQTVAATKIYVSIPAGIPSLDPGDADTSNHQTLDIPLRTVAAMQDRDTPQVVSIQRLRPGSQTVVAAFQEAAVTGEFTVRIVLSETPHEPGKFNGKIKVENGTKSGFVVGTPFAWHGGRTATTATPPNEPIQGATIRPHPIEGRYNHNGVITAALGDGVSPDTDTLFPPLAGVPEGLDEAHVPLPTGPNGMYWECRVTITPHRRADHVIVKIDEFHDGDAPRNYYYPHQVDRKPNGREQLRLPVNIPAFNLADGYKVILPHAEGAQITYAGGPGHYILTYDKAGSHIRYFHEKDEENKATKQTPAQLLYNVRETMNLPNLETFFANSGIVHLVSYGSHKAGDAYISEVMWGTDASQDPVNKSNWIEIRNGTTAAIGIGENMWALWFYEAHETPAAAYPANSAYEGPTGQAGTIIDVVGTKDANDLSWPNLLAGKGQSGRSNIDIARTEAQVLAPTTPLHSMYRMMAADGTPGDGQMATTWVQTKPPAVNLGIGRENAIVATPGAAPITTAEQVAAAEKETADKEKAAAEEARTTGTYPMKGDGRVYISEVMFAGGGTLPQWIEISNGDPVKTFNLSGWTLTVNNASADTKVSVGNVKITIPDGTMIAPNLRGVEDDKPSTILIVTERGRTSMTRPMESDQIIVLDEEGSSTEVDLINAGVLTGKYALLSSMAFEIILAPPAPAKTNVAALAATATPAEKASARSKDATESKARKDATDTVGNLGADGAAAWALPTSDDGRRSSIIRRHVQVARGPASPEDGTMAENWVLASDQAFADIQHIRVQSYYGAPSDDGTPGFRPGTALPVELSHFRPERQKDTGAVVITWSTQSELNNAGFFVKRSQQRDGEFKVINAAMVPGAGTTSEKQFYTYTDTTAQPNVVYYYQIEDVSLDGQRQTLTRGIRLKGHVSVAGKATTTWGELKNVQ